MKTINNINAEVIAKAAAEAGIRENEKYDAHIIAIDGDLCEMVLETEWNRITVYADTDTGEVLGLMAIAKSIDDLLASEHTAARAASSRRYRAA